MSGHEGSFFDFPVPETEVDATLSFAATSESEVVKARMRVHLANERNNRVKYQLGGYEAGRVAIEGARAIGSGSVSVGAGLIALLNAPRRKLAAAFTGSQLIRGGELLRRAKSGETGFSTLEGPSGTNIDIFSEETTKFSGEGSVNIIQEYLVNQATESLADDLIAEKYMTPDDFLFDVKTATGRPVKARRASAKSKVESARVMGGILGFTAELGLDLLTDPLSFVSFGSGGILLSARGGRYALPSVGLIGRGLNKLTGGRATFLKRAELIERRAKGKLEGLQIMGPMTLLNGVEKAGRGLAKSGDLAFRAILKTLPRNKQRALIRSAGGALKDMRHGLQSVHRYIKRNTSFANLPAKERALAEESSNGWLAGEVRSLEITNANQGLVFKNSLGLGVRHKRQKQEFITQLLDEGKLHLPATGALPVDFTMEQAVSVFRIMPTNPASLSNAKALAARKYSKWIKPEDVVGLVDDAVRLGWQFNDMGVGALERGLLTDIRLKYILHSIKNPIKLRSLRDAGRLKGLVTGDPQHIRELEALSEFTPFAIPRVLKGSIARGEHMGLKFEKRANVLLAEYQLNYLRNINLQNFHTDLLSKFGAFAEDAVFKNKVDTFLTPGVRSLFSGLKQPNLDGVLYKGFQDAPVLAKEVFTGKGGQYSIVEAGKALGIPIDQVKLPRSIARELAIRKEYMLKKARGAGITNNVVTDVFKGIFRTQTQLFKTLVTSPNPAFQANNIFGDIQRQAESLGLVALNPVRYADSLFMLEGSKQHLWRVGPEGVQVTPAILRVEAQNMGVLGSWSARTETQNILQQDIFGKVGEAGAFAMSGGLSGVGKQVGSAWEDWSRSTMYMNLRRKGFTMTGARNEVFRTLFNYFNGLAEWEQVVARNVIPFYSFLRFNAGFQLRAVVESPGRFAAISRVADVASAGQDQTWRDLLLPWEQALVNIGAGEDKFGRQQILGLRSTTLEATELIPRSLDYEDTSQALRTLIGRFHPALTGAIEYAIGTDPSTGRPSPHRAKSRNFRVFKHAPPMLRDFLEFSVDIDPKKLTTSFTVNAPKWALLSTLGLGRMITSLGKLDRAGIGPEALAHLSGYHDGTHPALLDMVPEDYTIAQGIIGAITGQSLRPFAESEKLGRQARQIETQTRELEDRLEEGVSRGQKLKFTPFGAF